MFRRSFFISGLIALLILGFSAARLTTVSAGDGIPDNCEYTKGDYYRPNIFPRYEPQNQRLMLVNWATGADEMVLAEGLGDTRIQSWSLDCRYLAAAVGPLTSMDTVVWDTTTGARMGSVPDAHQQPHHLTWGPGDELVVETRDGAVLWNVPTNSQITLQTGFNTTTSRDFSRLRWDTAHNQLIANLAVGGRAVYDLNTGAEVPLAANTDDSVAGAGKNTVLIAGKNYQCQDGYNYGYRHWFYQNGTTIPNVRVDYNVTDHMIVLQLTDQASPYETLEVLDTNVDASSFNFRGWSPDCRYAAASLGEPGHNATDTVVWDILENRRVGVFLDAREIVHPIHWSPAGDAMVIETRDGAYLWHLADDSRTLLTVNVETSLAGRRGIHSFDSDLAWTNDQLLAVTVGSANTVTAYDSHSGQIVGQYSSGSDNGPADFILSPDGSRIAVFRQGDGIGTLWNRSDNSHIPFAFTPSRYYGFSIAISPDNHYLAISTRSLSVWDLQNAHADGTPTLNYNRRLGYDMTFSNNDTLQSGSLTLNVVSGEGSNARDIDYTLTPLATAAVDGVSGWGAYRYSYYDTRRNVCDGLLPRYDAETHQLVLENAKSGETVRVIESNQHPIESLAWSPDCRYLYGDVHFTTTNNLSYDANPLDDASYDNNSYSIVFWDAQSGARIHEFTNPYSYETGSSVIWSPGSDRVLLRTTEGYFLYQFATNQTVLLTYPEDIGNYSSGIRPEFSMYWDYARGQVYLSATRGVFAFDMLSGAGRYLFTASPSGDCDYWGCTFDVSADNQFLFVNGYFALGVWNLDSLEHWQLDVQWGTARLGNHVAISPDNHYLVMVNYMTRVWDLQNLPDDIEDRDPIFNYAGPETRLKAVRFLDNTTIETTDAFGVIQHWDILTGAEIKS